MDLNHEYAAHQYAIMDADAATSDGDRLEKLAEATRIAQRITVFQDKLGAAAACAWSNAHLTLGSRPKLG